MITILRSPFFTAVVVSISVLFASEAESAWADAQKSGKQVIELGAVQSVQIEMPDASVRDFGSELEDVLVGRFTNSGKYIVVGRSPRIRALLPKDYQWTASATPSASVHVRIDALSFETGSKGEHTFYGFDERFRTPFNDGTLARKNEFPLKQVLFQPNWFDRTFDVKGSAPFDSASGLDLGDGVEINLLFAYVALKYASYRANLSLTIVVDSPLLGVHEERKVRVTGKGYFYDFSGGYGAYGGGIQIARKDAMNQAILKAIAGSYDAIEGVVSGYPQLAKVDAIAEDGAILLGTGPKAEVGAGTLYESLEVPGLTLQIVSSNEIGAVASLFQGNAADLAAGMTFRQAVSFSAARARAQGPKTIQVELADENIPQANLGKLQPKIDWAQALVQSVAQTVAFAYRFSRYLSYDQAFDSGMDAGKNARLSQDWFAQAANSSWGKRIGLDRARADASSSRTVVAIIDSGVDYNHPVIHGSVSGQSGWDFVSHDSRAYDDGYHGTQMASAVLSVAPQALILPIKAFNPFGVTSSAALYASFQYAVDHGAQVILCGWATRKYSAALEMGVAYARDHGVLVVAAAGDRGDDLARTAAYPASLSKKYENVLTVTSVDSKDQLVTVPGKFANYDPNTVKIAAPGFKIVVAEPREGRAVETSTGIAAALTAGAAARTGAADYQGMMDRVIENSSVISGLQKSVQGGRFLRVN